MTFAHRHIQALLGVSAPILPAFDYNFADDSGTLDGDFTFTRASDGTQSDSSGVLITQTTNAARVDDYVRVSGVWVNKGFRIEGPQENTQKQSENIDVSPWSKALNATVAINDAVAPDGNMTADKATDPGSSFSNLVSTTAGEVSNNETKTFSIYVLKDATPAATRYAEFRLRFAGGTPTEMRIALDTSDGSFLSNKRVGGGTVIGSDVIDADDYWRVWMAFENDATSNTDYMATLFPAIGANADLTTQDSAATGSIPVWGVEVKSEPFPSSYIATTSSSVIRAADVATITRAPSAAYTMEFETRTGLGAGVLWSYDDGTNQERVYVERNSSNEIHLRGVSGLVEQFDIDLGVVADDTDFKIMFRVAANDIAASLNGGAVGTDTDATMPTLTTQRLGMDYANARHWNSTVARMKEWASGLDNGYLIARSQ